MKTKLLEGVTIKSGSHESRDSGMCIMEAAAYVANEPHSDHPQCTCPVITAFMIAWNDALPNDAERDRLLKPLIPIIVGTRATKEIEHKRSLLALDWLIREYTPAWLDLVPSLAEHAVALRSSPTINEENAAQAGIKVSAAESAAWSAAWSAAESATRSAAESAAESAAGSAAWSAAWSAAESAAESAAWSAAGSAAESAARSAAWSAAESALQLTVDKLQLSGVELIKRMAACE